jgi:hypothetical protein
MAKKKTKITEEQSQRNQERIEKIKKKKLAKPHQLSQGEIWLLDEELLEELELNPEVKDKELWQTAIDLTVERINNNTTERFHQIRKR